MAGDSREVSSFDGTRIVYHVVGEGKPVLLANGLAAGLGVWQPQIEHFQSHYRFVCWQYRGLCAAPHESRRPPVELSTLAEDALAIVRAERIPRLSVVGWSLGGGVALELFRLAPDRVASLVFINGTARAPWLDASPRGVRALTRLVFGAGAAAGLLQSGLAKLAGTAQAARWAKRVRLVAPSADERLLGDVLGELSRMDPEQLRAIWQAWEEYDGSDVASHVDVPTLVVFGERDPFTPRAAVEQLAAEIRGAELLVLPRAGHCVQLDCPEHLNLRLEKFFRERGYASG